MNVKILRQNSTKSEKKLWQHLRSKQIEDVRFRRQFPIGPYIIDFICLKRRLVIEIDGGQHAIQTEAIQHEPNG